MPSSRKRKLQRVLELGADELMDRASYALRDNPRALAHVKDEYVRFCRLVVEAMKRAGRA